MRWRSWSPTRSNRAREAAEAIAIDYECFAGGGRCPRRHLPRRRAVFDEIQQTCFVGCGDAKGHARPSATRRIIAKIRLVNNRLSAIRMEPRAAVAEYDSGPRSLHDVDDQPVFHMW